MFYMFACAYVIAILNLFKREDCTKMARQLKKKIKEKSNNKIPPELRRFINGSAQQQRNLTASEIRKDMLNWFNADNRVVEN